MFNINFENVLKILPLHSEYKKVLQSEYEQYDEDLKFNVLMILYRTFNEYDVMLTEAKFSEYMAEVVEGKRKLSKTMYLEAKKEVYKEFAEILAGKREEQKEIEQIRQKLQSYLLTNASNT